MSDQMILPPHSIEAEKAVIGAVFMYPGDAEIIDLDPEAFYLEAHRLIWQAIRDLVRAGRKVDELTAGELLKARGQVGITGDALRLTEYARCLPFGANVEEYVSIVRDHADRRQALIVASELAKAAYDLRRSFSSAKTDAIDRLVTSSAGAGRIRHISELVSETWEELEERAKNPQDLYGVPTGFADFDNITGGLPAPGLTILAGEPGVGKTLLSVQMLVQAAQSGRPAAIYELEMSNFQLVLRIISAMTGVSTRTMRTGKLSGEDWTAITHQFQALSDLPLWVSDDTTWNTTSLRANLQKMRLQHHIEVFLVDYLGLLADTHGRDEIERTAYISRNLRQTTKDLELSGLAIHTMNKAGIDQAVKRSTALGGAVGVSYDADMICFLNHHIVPESERIMGVKPDPNLRTMTWAKNREGEPGRFAHLTKRPGLPAFADYTPEPVGGNGHKKAPF